MKNIFHKFNYFTNMEKIGLIGIIAGFTAALCVFIHKYRHYKRIAAEYIKEYGADPFIINDIDVDKEEDVEEETC